MLQQKQMFKVLCPMKKQDGGTYWMRLGTGFRNKDNSINIHLDALPTGEAPKLQLREFDDEDRRRMEGNRRSDRTDGASFAERSPTVQPSTASDTVPF